MPRSTDVRLVEASAATQHVAYRTPMKFGGRVVTEALLLEATVEVETASGARARGCGSMPLGNIWAWPSAQLPPAQSLAAMLELGLWSVVEAGRAAISGHPLEIAHELWSGRAAAASDIGRRLGLNEPMPKLAQMVATSPVEAALHDAYGRVHGRSAYDVLGPEFVNWGLEDFLGPEFHYEYLDRYTLRTPKARMPLYHLVGALDPLTPGDVGAPVGDGWPETLGEWIQTEGLFCLKIKLAGDDLAWDIDRVAAVERVVAEAQAKRGGRAWQSSLDFNERCPGIEYVLDFLQGLQERAPAAFERIQYIEQPLPRDLAARPIAVHAAAKIKPVVIDESLVDLESLTLSRELGYTGVALKACKGHGEALLMGAAAQKLGLFLCVQDLTCPGASFLHSASLAARIPTVAAIEGNARQYCPAGNRGWRERYAGMFQIADGMLDTSLLAGPGLFGAGLKQEESSLQQGM